ncbi:NAD-dependent protein deacylase [Pseudomonas sp. CFBP 13711]|uniref:SIR2 family NAD-dependent protein deacylase n=1 Tax=unclassified Pseudomonas TaxID=196821 RepID=UPI00177B25DA|nr:MULTISPECIES: NAD-dependent protein deacylase [unclassified Pseudomonas]MBD8710109.1 NAD-dependent protein deacylase [Pseudomonas sp. CFBP 13711]MBD8715397.1 NAD-dependent protein deacylase [Pseudomonas sp. CFBP 13715]
MERLHLAVEALVSARSIVCFSGAGISAESGIPTYRDTLTGLWARYDPAELETANAFRRNPKLVWGWYLWRRQQAANALPNAAHCALQRLECLGYNVPVITQNIDDLHERAGSSCVHHLHGTLATPKCFACHRPAAKFPVGMVIPAEGILVEPPRCGHCGGKVRPGVVWYGENLSSELWRTAVLLVKNCDVLISVGTSGTVTPAANLLEIAQQGGATVIHINIVDVGTNEPREIVLVGEATKVLTQLVTLLLQKVCPS